MANLTVYENFSPRIVKVDAPDVAISIQELYNKIRSWEDDNTHEDDDSLIDAAGKENLGGGVTVGITAELKNAQVAFEARTTSISSGLCTSNDTTGTKLIDSGATFITDGVEVGAMVINITDQSVGSVLSIDSETQLTIEMLDDGSINQWTINDVYKVWNWTLCEVSGGNLVAVDDVDVQIDALQPRFGVSYVRTSSSSATLQELQELQYSTFQRAVWVDENATEDGNLSLGTPENPVNTIEKAIPIAVANGFDTIRFLSDYTFGATVNISNYELVGQGLQKTSFTFVSGCTLAFCEIRDAIVEGTALGIVGFYNCKINPLVFPTSILTSVEVIIDNCLFGLGVTQLPSNFTGQITMRHNESDVPFTGTPQLDVNGAACKIIARGHTGGFEFLNCTSALFECSFDLNAGQVKLGPTNTAGKLVVRGEGKFIDLNGDYIENGISAGGMTVINETSLYFMVQILRMTKNKVTISGDIATVYKEDGTTVWEMFDLANRQRIPL